MSFIIRRATDGDAAAIADLFLAARAEMTYLPRLHEDEETRAFIAGMVKHDAVLVAERDGRIAGFAALAHDGERGWLHHLYVDPLQHNAGAGSALLAQAKEDLPGGFSLWTFQANLGARRFYERHGLTAARLTDGAENEEKLPDILFEWRPEAH